MSDFGLMFQGRRRVGKGGMALLWHKRLDHKLIARLSFEDDIGLQLEISPTVNIYLFRVYLPCSNNRTVSFHEYVDKLSNLIGLYSVTWLFLGLTAL